ncbi:MAG TPA: hypothetical protein PK228_18320 [Saprospiraceae bacterium]|nr:hypothetical protein [Saprospiraceae bacterium]
MQTANNACICPKEKRARKREGIPLALSIFIAILPKCPFCVFGYSSVMVLCSGSTVFDYEPGPMSYLPLGIVAAVIASLIWNFRGRRTWWALALVLTGGLILAHAQRVTGHVSEYFTGVALIFSGVLVNGVFLHFWRKTKKKLLA